MGRRVFTIGHINGNWHGFAVDCVSGWLLRIIDTPLHIMQLDFVDIEISSVLRDICLIFTCCSIRRYLTMDVQVETKSWQVWGRGFIR